jgi:hypothetical protein
VSARCATLLHPATPASGGRYIESFNGRLRDERGNFEMFSALAEVGDKLERW